MCMQPRYGPGSGLPQDYGPVKPLTSVMGYFTYDPIAPDPEGIINQGQGNLTARAIQIRQGDPINERALLNLFQAVIANNRAGGWRKVTGS